MPGVIAIATRAASAAARSIESVPTPTRAMTRSDGFGADRRRRERIGGDDRADRVLHEAKSAAPAIARPISARAEARILRLEAFRRSRGRPPNSPAS